MDFLAGNLIVNTSEKYFVWKKEYIRTGKSQRYPQKSREFL